MEERHISKALRTQIRAWQWYSVIAPGAFAAIATGLYWAYGTPFQSLFYAAVTIFGITCVAWWHWSLATMMTMLSIMRDTDDHFEKVSRDLEKLRSYLEKQSNHIH